MLTFPWFFSHFPDVITIKNKVLVFKFILDFLNN